MDAPPPSVEIRAYRPGDEEAILACFNRVFARENPNFVPRTLAHWRWKFRDNPCGNRIVLAVTEGGEIVAHYAALPVRAMFRGGPVTFHQGIDSMADPRFRRLAFARGEGGERGPSLFAQAGRRLIERWGLSGIDKFGYGLPIPIAWRIGREWMGYEVIRTLLLLFAEVGKEDRGAGAGEITVEEVADIPSETDLLWERARPEWEAASVRDARYLRWRYVEHPDLRYRIALARGAEGGLRGLAVYRRGEFSDRDQGLLVEWLVPRGEEEAARALLSWARACARPETDRLAAVFPETSPWFLFLQKEGFLVEGTKYILVGRNYHGPEDATWFRKNWYFTLGDFDVA
ncbi:MAG TPA: GNAT family N-acetyltransferase [Planctomycetota bacterium]|nr:GNAT family N-acetyltransferase [Planctomycetota bacterium]